MEYYVSCYTFENELIDGADFDTPLYGHDYFMDYKPTYDEVKNAYGKGWEYVKKIFITEMNLETGEEKTDFYENKEY